MINLGLYIICSAPCQVIMASLRQKKDKGDETLNLGWLLEKNSSTYHKLAYTTSFSAWNNLSPWSSSSHETISFVRNAICISVPKSVFYGLCSDSTTSKLRVQSANNYNKTKRKHSYTIVYDSAIARSIQQWPGHTTPRK